MGFDVFVTDPGVDAGELENPDFVLDDDEIFWSLYPYVKRFQEMTGREISLYGDATLGADEMMALRRVLESARSDFATGPEKRMVKVGESVLPNPDDLTVEVSREDSLGAIAALDSVATRALREGKHLVFVGD